MSDSRKFKLSYRHTVKIVTIIIIIIFIIIIIVYLFYKIVDLRILPTQNKMI